MKDELIMILILLFLAFDILFKAKIVPVNENFFDKTNSQAMRGFWCLIVILVHVPALYQNRIQDMIGSFAYIGVTFFFMTSAYGLTLSQDKNSQGISYFWRKRLPKLLITTWVVSILFSVINMCVFGEQFKFTKAFGISEWVKWLIACYFAFWLTNILLKKNNSWKIATCILIVLGSLAVYCLLKNGLYSKTAWTTECFGFIWGIVLASIVNSFSVFFEKKWLLKWGLCTFFSLVLGVGYLKFKTIPFFGDYVLKIILGLAITLFVLIANIRIKFGNSINLFLGTISFEVYLVHGHVFRFLGKIYEWNSSGVFIITSIVATIIVSVIVHYIADGLVKTIMKMPVMQNRGK